LHLLEDFHPAEAAGAQHPGPRATSLCPALFKKYGVLSTKIHISPDFFSGKIWENKNNDVEQRENSAMNLSLRKHLPCRLEIGKAYIYRIFEYE